MARPKPAPRVGFVSLGCPKALVDSENILTRLRAERIQRKALAESRATMYASEPALAREWDTPEEDEAWASL